MISPNHQEWKCLDWDPDMEILDSCTCWFVLHDPVIRSRVEQGTWEPLDLQTLSALWQIPVHARVRPNLLDPRVLQRIQAHPSSQWLIRVYDNGEVERLYQPPVAVQWFQVNTKNLADGVNVMGFYPSSAKLRIVTCETKPDTLSEEWREAEATGLGVFYDEILVLEPKKRTVIPDAVAWYEAECLFIRALRSGLIGTGEDR